MFKRETSIVQGKHGRLLYFPADRWVGRSLEMYGEWSDQEIGLIEQLVPKGGVIVEAGSNVGAHAVPLSKHLGAEGKLIVFEPQAVVYELLTRNLRENGCSNVEPICAAVGAEAGAARMGAIEESADGFANVAGGTMRGDGAGETVDVLTIDGMELERLDLIKADVEGWECELLAGARATIARCRPLLYLENDKEDRSAELIALVMSLGYRLFWHTPPLYDPRNSRGASVNIFPGYVSANMLCVPEGREVKIALREIRTPQDDWHEATRPVRTLLVNKGTSVGKSELAQKTVAVHEGGAYGDALFASSAIWHLKRQGYHVTFYTAAEGGEVLKHDPNIDAFVVLDRNQAVLGDVEAWFNRERKQFDLSVNLAEAVAKNGIAWPADRRFLWSDAARRQAFGGNYLELVHKVAEVPNEIQQRFYATPAERREALALKVELAGGMRIAVIAGSGSTAPKFWPYVEELAIELRERGFWPVLLGDLRGQVFGDHVPGAAIGTALPIRQALALALVADIVIGQETVILNAMALEPMPKIVLLSHSTHENLTRGWKNTIALAGNAPCWPCHRLHFDFKHCPRDEKTGAAACQALIDVPRVLTAVDASFRALAAA